MEFVDQVEARRQELEALAGALRAAGNPAAASSLERAAENLADAVRALRLAAAGL